MAEQSSQCTGQESNRPARSMDLGFSMVRPPMTKSRIINREISARW